MRWPLKNQILISILLLLTSTIGAITFANIRSTIASNRDAELKQLDNIVDLVNTTRFPLTSSVLEKMKLLSGADFVLVSEDDNGKIISKTLAAPENFADLNTVGESAPAASVQIIAAENSYYHTSVKCSSDQNPTSESALLNVFVTRQSNQAIWWRASRSPLIIAFVILPLAFLVSLAMANHVTRPLAKLETQVKKIAGGDLEPIPDLGGSKELQDLNNSINEMAIKLQDHESQLRKNERLRTMVQFGNSIAHHLRNSATGCKMAVELLAIDNDEVAQSENYEVAVRQLGLMDNYIKRFLLLSQSSDSNFSDQAQWIDMKQMLESVVFLVGPSAKHLGVELNVKSECAPSLFEISEEDAQQLMMNLITNGITAASQLKPASSDDVLASEPPKPFVEVKLTMDERLVMFSVTDSGPGPPVEIAASMFEPFVTGSKEGTGLGLSLVEEISKRAGGEISWIRENNCTSFTFEAPMKPGPSQSNPIAETK